MELKATKIQKTDISISADEIREIIKSYLIEKHGLYVQPNDMKFVIKTVYDGTMGDPGTDVFSGVEISLIKRIDL